MKKIAIITNPDNDKDYRITESFERELLKYPCEFERIPLGVELSEDIDMVLVFGGDGTVMRVSHMAAPLGLPILGVNMGRVGYTLELEKDEKSMLSLYFEEKYTVEERMMLSACCPSGEVLDALNDVVVSLGERARMTNLSLKSNDEEVASYFGNGVIISTPTGSSAYSLSAGGPIISPTVSCLLVTPICSHSLSDRPVIFDDSSILTVTNNSRNETKSILNRDGIDIAVINVGESITVKKSKLKTKFIRLKNDGFCSILSKKMRK